jgi:RNA recognition motif-containing protein
MEEAPAQSAKLFVGQIPKDVTEDGLNSYFEEFGTIKELSIIRDTATGMSRGCAFVTYFEHASADKAVENLHDKVKLPNVRISSHIYDPRH